MFIFKRKKQVEMPLEKIPAHIGIIMDGNGRWAKTFKTTRYGT